MYGSFKENNVHLEYIEDIIYKVSNTISFSHRITLGGKDSNGNRIPFIRFYEYDSNKYKDVRKLSTAKILNLKDYFMIQYSGYDKISENDNALKVYFSYDNIFKLAIGMQNTYQWFVDPKYANLYEYDQRIPVKINPKFDSLCTEITTKHSHDYASPVLRFKPAIISDKDDSNLKYEGVQVLTTVYNVCIGTLTIDELYSAIYFLNNYNMYNCGRALLSSVLSAKNLISQLSKK